MCTTAAGQHLAPAERLRQAFDALPQSGPVEPVEQCSAMSMLQQLLHAHGVEASYCDLMAISGFAGQFAYHPKEFTWTTFVPPRDPFAPIAHALGIRIGIARPRTLEECWEILEDKLQHGVPVLGNYLESLVFLACKPSETREQREVLVYCQPFITPAQWWNWEHLRTEWYPGFHDYLVWYEGPEPSAAPPEETACDVMLQLVRCARRDYRQDSQHGQKQGVSTGLHAIARYAVDIGDVEKRMSRNAAAPRAFFDPGWGSYAVYPQWTARYCSSRYLRQASELFEAEAGGYMRAAADAYALAYGHWRRWEAELGRPSPAEAEAYSGDLYIDRWADPSRRSAASAAVHDALDAERAAIAAVEAALAALGL